MDQIAAGDDSPRSAFKRARDRSLKELGESFVSQQLSQKISEANRSQSPSPAPGLHKIVMAYAA